MTGYIKSFCIAAFVTIILFFLINVGSHIYLDRNLAVGKKGDYFVGRKSDKGVDIRKKIFGTDDQVLLDAYANPPGIRPHPVLHFTEGRSTPFYTVGVEDTRYLPGWTDEKVREALSGKNAVYVFGGSTVFGDGVPDESTVVAYLNAIDGHRVYVNFGVQAYDSIREVDKLLYLLRKGYRPKAVIFIDGLNDVTTFARSPYEIHDTPRVQGLVLDRGQVPLVFGFPKTENMFLALAYSFPVTHLAHRLSSRNDEGGAFIRKSADAHGLEDWQELMYLHHNWAKEYVNRTDLLADEIIGYYKENISFVEQLGEAFGFDVYFIYQPIGLLDSQNAFLNQEFYESPKYAVYKGVDLRIKNEIEAKSLGMKDCSRVLAESEKRLMYVDATHYSPSGNNILAMCVFNSISIP